MTAPLPPAAPLAPHGACVVQVRAGTALTPEGLHGRIEPSVSGQAALYLLRGVRGVDGTGADGAARGRRVPGPHRLPSQAGHRKRVTCRRTLFSTVGSLRHKPKEHCDETSHENGTDWHAARRLDHHRTAGDPGR